MQIKSTLRVHLTPVNKQLMLVRMLKKMNLHTLLLGIEVCATTVEVSMNLCS
jgi:hypothetical protein